MEPAMNRGLCGSAFGEFVACPAGNMTACDTLMSRTNIIGQFLNSDAPHGWLPNVFVSMIGPRRRPGSGGEFR